MKFTGGPFTLYLDDLQGERERLAVGIVAKGILSLAGVGVFSNTGNHEHASTPTEKLTHCSNCSNLKSRIIQNPYIVQLPPVRLLRPIPALKTPYCRS